MRRPLLATLMLLLASLAVAATAVGGGWAQVTVTDIPPEPPAGEETVVGLMVMQHGVTAVSWPKITVVATDAASGATIRADARAQGETGAYVVALTFPAAGEWTLSFDSPDLFMEDTAVVAVVAVQAVAPVVSSGADPVAIALIAVALGLIALALIAAARRGRRRVAREAPAPAHG